MTRSLLAMGVMAFAGGAALYVSSAAQAATERKNLTVSVQVVNLCDLTLGSSNLSFGSIEPGEEVDAQVSINIICTNNVVNPPTLTVGNGLSFGLKPSFTSSRAMLRAGGWVGEQMDLVAYNFYSDAGRSALIGSNGSFPLSTPGGGIFAGSIETVLYGRIPGSQAANSGNFSDTVVIALTYQPI